MGLLLLCQVMCWLQGKGSRPVDEDVLCYLAISRAGGVHVPYSKGQLLFCATPPTSLSIPTAAASGKWRSRLVTPLNSKSECRRFLLAVC